MPPSDPARRSDPSGPHGPAAAPLAGRPLASVAGSGWSDLAAKSLIGIFVILSAAACWAGRDVLLPMGLALLASFALAPVVRGLDRLRVPRPIGAALVVVTCVAVLAWMLAALAEPAATWVDRAPESLRAIDRKLRVLKQPLREMQAATREVENVTRVATEPDVRVVSVQEPSLSSTLLTVAQELGVTLTLTIILLYFLLASHGAVVRRLLSLLVRGGDRPAVELVYEIEHQVSRCLFTIFTINVALAVVMALVMWALGMPSPLLWGVMAGVLNFVPYLGPLVGAAVVGAVALLTFPDLAHGLMVPATFLLVTGIEGFLVTPAVLGRRMQLSPVALLLAVMTLAGLWGLPGALIALPLLAVVQISVERLAPTSPLAVLLAP